MSLVAAYELGFALSATSALLTVLLGGELPLWAWASLIVPALSAVQHARGRSAPGWVGTLLGGMSLTYGAAVLVGRGMDAALLGTATALVGLYLARLVTRRTLGHDLQVLLIALLLVFAGAGLNTGLSYGLVFVMFAVSSVWALVTRQLVEGAQREAERDGGAALEVTLGRRDIVTPVFFAASAFVSLVILGSTLALFVLFPRVGIGKFGMNVSRGRLPTDISLRGGPMADGAAAVVARVRGPSFEEFSDGLYLRAMVMETAARDGFRPRRGPARREEPPAGTDEPRMYEIFMQPTTEDRLLTLGPVARLTVLAGGSANPSVRAQGQRVRGNGEVELTLGGPVRYSVVGWLGRKAVDLDPDELAAPTAGHAARMQDDLVLPRDLDPRVAQLALQLTQGATTTLEKAQALRAFLLREFGYTLEQPNGDTEDPLTSFLFEDRRGHCEYFATALATLLRASGVPSRVIGGYQGGAWDAEAKLVVFTGEHAHAWVEWYAPGVGWVTDDATPASEATRPILGGYAAWLERLRRGWDEYVLDYGLADQFQLASGLGRQLRALSFTKPGARTQAWLVTIGAGALAGVGVVQVLRRLRARRRRRPNPLARELERLVADALGEEIDPATTLREAAARAKRAMHPEGAVALAVALDIYEAERFGRGVPPLERARGARAIKAARRGLLEKTPT